VYESNGTKINILLREVQDLMKQKLKHAFDEVGLTTPQIFVIASLDQCGSLKISELSEKLSLSNSTVSGIVDRLEKCNFVKRNRSEEDRRVVLVSLTEEAHKIIKTAFHEKINKAIDDELVNVPIKEVEEVIQGLQTLKRILG
jgi:DNA-binding MarR family transcriptional regulator